MKNKKLIEYLFQQDGIDNIFANLAQITASGALFQFSKKAVTESKLAAISLLFIGIIFLSLSMIYGLRKIIIPFLKVLFDDSQKFSEMEVGIKRAFFSKEFFTYMLISILYCCLLNWLLGIVLKSAIS
jgi:hypothetical protein